VPPTFSPQFTNVRPAMMASFRLRCRLFLPTTPRRAYDQRPECTGPYNGVAIEAWTAPEE
jgi:hypothetical protein